jgi:hypothetical protein
MTCFVNDDNMKDAASDEPSSGVDAAIRHIDVLGEAPILDLTCAGVTMSNC